MFTISIGSFHAKELNYTPKSAIAPTATVNVVVQNVTTNQLILPQSTNFITSQINGVNYNFITVDSYISTVIANTAIFPNVEIKQGVPVNYTFPVTAQSYTTNPPFMFEIPDPNIDTTTLQVSVQQSGTNTAYQIYNLAINYLILNGNSLVYFLQLGQSGNFQIYFGDGILGAQLIAGNIVNVSYISTGGTAAAGANNFGILGSIAGFTNIKVLPLTPATAGGTIESLASIKFNAPKAYSAQGRAVTKDDYITLIQQNQLGYAFDAVNVWGGEENDPPVYGQVFIAIKPSGAYTLTDTQKQNILTQVVQPISILTVTPNILDPDYTYIKIVANVLYDPTKTNNTPTQLQNECANAISSFAITTLNTFDSTFALNKMNDAVEASDQSIIAAEATIQIQKKFYPNLTTSSTYTFDFDVALQRGLLTSGISSSPAIQYQDPSNPSNIIDGVYIEEVPSSVGGVASVNVLNPGFNYAYPPIVTILGDGYGATAVALLNSIGEHQAD